MIDLPPDSLGPKPTKKQMELLKKMATPGATIHRWSGTSFTSQGAYIKYEGTTSEDFNRSTLEKYVSWGWLDCIQSDFRGSVYQVSERGKKVIDKGVTRK